MNFIYFTRVFIFYAHKIISAQLVEHCRTVIAAEGHGFELRSSLKNVQVFFLKLKPVAFTTPIVLHLFNVSSAVHLHEFSDEVKFLIRINGKK